MAGAASPWPMIHTERAALVADLEGVSDAQWETPSLCELWTVRDVVAHITATAKMTQGKFFTKMIGSGFRFNAMAAKDIARERGGSPADTLAGLRSQLTATTHPPGPLDAMLGEQVLHGDDIRRPLGIAHAYPPEVLIRVADFYKGSNLLIGTKKRIAGLRLRASDVDWSTGDGPEVSGPMLSLVMAMTGRKAALADLSGEGLATLQSRN
ncbi:MAG TPA: maleylpyruvate isomerase family mycothiol-dependent enzyme [Candidatus Dormibacteraeota bacterium]|nr:maleylpyruvate isomerase family mycothiol-dependent enzyme [Candidatus Dormibacteraeota bacterium]